MRQKKESSEKSQKKQGMLDKVIGIIGGGCIISAIYTWSIIPLIIGGIAVFLIMSFINGLQ